jgi:hypothetical protein
MTKMGTTFVASNLYSVHEIAVVVMLSYVRILVGLVKLGHPVPESNLSSDLKRAFPQHTHLYIPFSLDETYCPVNGISVSFFLVTRYCSGVRFLFHCSLLLEIFCHRFNLALSYIATASSPFQVILLMIVFCLVKCRRRDNLCYYFIFELARSF